MPGKIYCLQCRQVRYSDAKHCPECNSQQLLPCSGPMWWRGTEACCKEMVLDTNLVLPARCKGFGKHNGYCWRHLGGPNKLTKLVNAARLALTEVGEVDDMHRMHRSTSSTRAVTKRVLKEALEPYE